MVVTTEKKIIGMMRAPSALKNMVRMVSKICRSMNAACSGLMVWTMTSPRTVPATSMASARNIM